MVASPADPHIGLVVEGEGDCVAEVGPTLRKRADDVSRVPVQVALADRDFEDWLYSSAETLYLGWASTTVVSAGCTRSRMPCDQPRTRSPSGNPAWLPGWPS